MLTRIYIDNYKCLVNFDLKLGPIQLLLGENGSGKSALFDLLLALKSLVCDGGNIARVFPEKSLTRWQNQLEQRFEIEVQQLDITFLYALTIEFKPSENVSRITREVLTVNGNPLFSFINGYVQLYRDDHSEGPKFSSDWSKSALGNVPPGIDNHKLTNFKLWLANLMCLRLDPIEMTARSEDVVSRPDFRMRDFASWYRYMSHLNPNGMISLYDDLKEVITSFDSLPFEPFGPTSSQLNVRLSSEGAGAANDYSFAELSDGQRILIMLYAVLNLGIRAGGSVFLDEPDNYVALREIKPWLMALEDRIAEVPDAQALLISHNAGIIDDLAGTRGVVLWREGGGHTRWSPFKAPEDTTLSASELIQRGWND